MSENSSRVKQKEVHRALRHTSLLLSQTLLLFKQKYNILCSNIKLSDSILYSKMLNISILSAADNNNTTEQYKDSPKCRTPSR